MKLINKLEKKFGRYSISNLIHYIIILYVVGLAFNLFMPDFYGAGGVYQTYLSLDIQKLFHGQIWRLFTFLIMPPDSGNIIFAAIELYFYYILGKTLENIWGSFRFNLYYFSGIILSIIVAIIVYLFTGFSINLGLTYVNRSMFFAFATVFPNMQFLLFFIIPIKAKYIAYLNGAWIFFDIFQYFRYFGFEIGLAYTMFILIAMANFLIFFLNTRNIKRLSPKELKRKNVYKNKVKKALSQTRHKCCICGRTEEDDDSLEFRFCSKCDGEHEYCMEHLFTHEHVHK